jgi:hypothetical protein
MNITEYRKGNMSMKYVMMISYIISLYITSLYIMHHQVQRKTWNALVKVCVMSIAAYALASMALDQAMGLFLTQDNGENTNVYMCIIIVVVLDSCIPDKYHIIHSSTYPSIHLLIHLLMYLCIHPFHPLIIIWTDVFIST